MTQPNILFAFADDWGRYASIYKDQANASPLNQLISTPNIDKIGREGATFTNAVVPAPTCTPCRSSVLSGRYFWQTRLGAILQGAVWDENIPTYPKVLEENGYHIGATYKTWGPGVSVGVPAYGDESHYYETGGKNFNQFSHYVTNKVNEGVDQDEAKGELYQEVQNNFESFLTDNSEEKPWCYWWGPTNTHRTWEKGSGKKLWNIDPDDLKGKMPDFFPDVHDVREDVADYLGECTALDAGLGVLLKMLEERNELDNTLIVLSGDHGIPGFPRAKANLYDIGAEVCLLARLPNKIKAGTTITEMTNLMDLAPTFLDAAGVSKPKGMTAQSIWPKLTGTATEEKEDWVITGRERHVATARELNLPYPHRAIRTKDYLYIRNFKPERWPMGDPNGMDDLNAEPIPWKDLENNTRAAYSDLDAGPTKAWMIHNRNKAEHTHQFQLGFGKRPFEELYSIKQDPHHMTNLAEDSNYESVKQELWQKLKKELIKQKDPRITEENCRFENSPYTDVYSHGGDEAEAAAPDRLNRSGSECL